MTHNQGVLIIVLLWIIATMQLSPFIGLMLFGSRPVIECITKVTDER